jgi:hypothetical protein
MLCVTSKVGKQIIDSSDLRGLSVTLEAASLTSLSKITAIC